MERTLFNRILQARESARAVAVLTIVDTGEQFLYPDDIDGLTSRFEEVDTLKVDIDRAIGHDKSAIVTTNDQRIFIHVHNPALRMIIIGAVHISQALVPLAVVAGYQVTVIDPRRAFASDDRFPGVNVSTDWPDRALEEQKPDSRTALVTLTHDPKLDDPALQVGLNSDVFYIGSLGSRKTHSARLQRLADAGFDDKVCGRIHGPIGLNIGASSPAEIAISIMAEVTKRLRGVPD